MPKYFVENISELLILTNWEIVSHLCNLIINDSVFFILCAVLLV